MHPNKIEDGSDNSEQLHEEEGSEQEVDSEQMFRIGSNDLEDTNEQVLGIEANELGDSSEQVLEFESNDQDNSEPVLGIESNNHEKHIDQGLEIESTYHENGGACDTIIDDQNGLSREKSYPPPVVGMEFDSYDDAYNYYNCYAKELGFAIRVKSSWTKRNSKEKRGAVLCCNCEGFKTIKEAGSRRKETRTGCLAMIRLRLVESNRWRVDEVKLEHNHLFDPERAQNSKSHKKMDAAGEKRKLEPPLDVEVQTIKLYRTPVVDTVGYGSLSEKEISSQVDQFNHLKLRKGDAQVIYNYFCRMQLTDPNFFYVMDLNDEGHLRNVFWIDSRSRAAYGYFADVITLDTTCLSNKYEIPLLAFLGVNHHGQSIMLGCGLLVDESLETYIWLLRAWLTCMSGRPPQTILTDQTKSLQTAIAEVFPRVHHRLCLSFVMRSILENLGELQESGTFHNLVNRTVHSCLKVDEFEIAWKDMVLQFGIKDHEFFRALYEDRERWAPVYLKDTFFAGMLISQPGESLNPFFDGYVHKETTLKEFFDIYDLVLQKKHQNEALHDFESKELSPMLKTGRPYELQLSKVYTKELFSKFQEEVEMMTSCLSITQIHPNGSTITYMVKEREEDGNMRGIRNFEVMYDKAGAEVRCICGCFNFKGYLCRHALCVLNYNRVDEVPTQYILSRWRKDVKRLYVPDLGSNCIDVSNPVQWFDHLYRRALQVVEEGMTSQDHFMVAWQAFKESLNKVRLVGDKHV